ncbi:unnamed protein product [Leptidea sinapis]|uniref:Mediator of RNA polymerase II transcription subunit 15 n=1 Tax=Leptidea sinapis TaxID=189913 RepID=A0A5E4Q858_9NEOP|nr:unnamed protein product [Leptidea sinapis]
MDNTKFNTMAADDNNWRTQSARQTMVAKIEEVIQRSGMQVARNSSEMENHVFMKAKTREEYMNMIAKLILHVREMSQPKQNQGGPNMQVQNQNQPGPGNQVPNQGGQQPQGPNSQPGMATDPINALQNMASQGTRNQMMNMAQSQMQQGVMGPNPGMTMQGQLGQQGPIVQQGQQSQTATNLLQTLNRPQLNMQLQNKLGGSMGMVPNQGQMGNNMVGGMGMGNPMSSQLQSQLAGSGMQGQMMPNMSMSNAMQVPMTGSSTMVGQMQCNQVGGMSGQMVPNNMQGQMQNQMVGGMGGNQMVNMNMLQMHGRAQGKPDVGMMGPGYAARGPPPNQFLRQSPSPSASSPNMGGPSPVSMDVEKLTKMKNLLDILSNPNKRMPLETLIKCEVVLEKLDFKRSEGVGLSLPPTGKEQIFNPLLEVVNNCLQSPLANHTLKRTFGSALDALNGPPLKNLPPPPPQKQAKLEEPTMEIPDVLQGEIARLDSRFKVSLEPLQLSGGSGAITLTAQLDDARLPFLPTV